MKVKLKKSNPDERLPNLSKDKLYTVLSIEVGREIFYRIERHDGTPILYPASAFLIVDARPCKIWIINTEGNSIDFAPKEFLGDFWENYFNGEPEAVNTYKTIRDFILEEN